mgnify:FL=1
MLVVTRKRDQAIVIGDGIEVRVLRTSRDHVRLGISAPSDVTIHRREVFESIRSANAAAAMAADATALEWVRGRMQSRGPVIPQAPAAPLP